MAFTKRTAVNSGPAGLHGSDPAIPLTSRVSAIPCPYCEQCLVERVGVDSRSAEDARAGQAFHVSIKPTGTRALYCHVCDQRFSTAMSDADYREATRHRSLTDE